MSLKSFKLIQQQQRRMNFLKKSQPKSEAPLISKQKSSTDIQRNTVANCITLVDATDNLFKIPPHKYKGDELEIREYTNSFLELKTILSQSDASKFDELPLLELQAKLTKLKDAIHKLVSTERLDRTLGHHRLRRPLDKILGEIQLIKVNLLAKSTVSSEMQAQVKFMISAALGSEIASQWITSFGFANFVPWSNFCTQLQKWISYDISTDEERVLKFLLVCIWRFGDFITAFGPLKSKSGNCILNMKVLVHEKWFGGFVTRFEAEGLLHNCVEGTFLVRFSKTLGQFAYSLVGAEKVYHVPIIALNGQFSVIESNTKTQRNFNSMHDMIQFYRGTLIKPLPTTMYLEEWFHGDLTAEEAAEAISGTEAGTFLLRFSASQPGSIAVSFLDEKLTPRQLLLSRLKDGKWQSSSNKEFVQESISNKLLRRPFINPVSTVSSVLLKWHEEARHQNSIIDSIWKPFME